MSKAYVIYSRMQNFRFALPLHFSQHYVVEAQQFIRAQPTH